MDRDDDAGRVAVVEPRCYDLEHIPFNAALVAAVLAAFPKAPVDVYGDVGHLRELERLLALTRAEYSARLSWIPVEIPARRSAGWQRAAAVTRLISRLNAAFRQRAPRRLVIATTDPFVLTLLKPLLFSTWAGLPTVAVFHELLAVLGRGRHSTRHWGLAASLALPHPKALTYLVLAESIHARLQQVAPRTAVHTRSFEHPSLLADLPSGGGPPVVPPLRFGFVGGGRSAKGIHPFLELARAVRSAHPDVTFEIVGSVPADIPRADLAGLAWSDEKLPLQEFVDRLRRLTYVIWLGDPAHYQLVASGSLVDAIAVGVPVVCQGGSLVDHLFRQLGEIGVTGRSPAEVQREIIRMVTTFSADSYQRQRDAARAAQARLAPEFMAATIRDALTRH